jgi:electron transfer flavoprotein alpha subunit
MKILTFIDQSEGKLKKTVFEIVSYAREIAKQTNGTVEGIILGKSDDDLSVLGKYGLSKLHHVQDERLNYLDSKLYSKVISEAASSLGSELVIFSNNISGKAIAPRVSARLKAGLVSGAMSLPSTNGGFVVRKTVFSGKAFANVSITTPVKIIALNPNSYKSQEAEGTVEIVPMQATVPDSSIRVKSVNKVTGSIPLSEAELVVSGGRGLKGPEHWGMIEELAQTIGAATACSRAVADAHWRPHHEHVGQTGLAISPNLYLAIGISGAIQHLAGVNRSKVIVVINKDPEAPFFKAADYGIVGDAFEVVPRLIEAAKKIR